MPPKRKRATGEEAASAEPKTTRATRSSARNKTTAVNDPVAALPAVANNETEVVAEPAPKKQRKNAAKTTAPKASAAKKKTTGNAKAQPISLPRNNGDAQVPAGGEMQANASSSTRTASKPAKASTKPKSAAVLSKAESYTPTHAAALFNEYVDEDDADVIGPEGFERLCSDAGVSLEGALPLILAWQMGATEMAKVKKAEWEQSTSDLRISSLVALATALHDLENLLVLDQGAVPKTKKKSATNAASPELYNRKRYNEYADDTTKAFSELYTFCFTLAKPPQSRNIDIETACAFWSVLVTPRYPIMQDIIGFINDKGAYKGVTKDLWSMMLEFCRSISPSLEDYEADGAWPTLLDDFVSWKKGKTDDASMDTVAGQ